MIFGFSQLFYIRNLSSKFDTTGNHESYSRRHNKIRLETLSSMSNSTILLHGSEIFAIFPKARFQEWTSIIEIFMHLSALFRNASYFDEWRGRGPSSRTSRQVYCYTKVKKLLIQIYRIKFYNRNNHNYFSHYTRWFFLVLMIESLPETSVRLALTFCWSKVMILKLVKKINIHIEV